MGTLAGDLETILALVYLLWIYGWAKNQLGSAKLAILFSVIVVYLGFFTHTELIWLPVIIFFIAFFGKPFLEKLPGHGGHEHEYERE